MDALSILLAALVVVFGVFVVRRLVRSWRAASDRGGSRPATGGGEPTEKRSSDPS
ncbi:MAG: hypothetical protein ACRDHI_13850 [Actinomycetota bacterium]